MTAALEACDRPTPGCSLAALFSCWLSACSFFFDPARVPSSNCPTSADRCPAADNATPSCVERICRFTCVAGFRDADGRADNGCEATCPAPPAPAGVLVSTSGKEIGSIRWTFSLVPEAVAYRLCTSFSAGSSSCTTVPLSACSDTECTFDTPNLPPNTAIFGQVQSIGSCGNASSEQLSPRAEGLTFSTPSIAPWNRDDGNCAVVPTVGNNAVSVEHDGTCHSSAVVGDERWTDGVFEVELQSRTSLPAAGGILFSRGPRRLAIVTGPSALNFPDGVTQIRESVNGGAWRVVASSTAAIAATGWSRLRVVVKGNWVSVSLGAPTLDPSTEVIRWHDQSPLMPRRLGLVTWTPFQRGLMEFRQLTATTAALLPPPGEKSKTVRFTVPSQFVAWSILGGDVRITTCPGFSAACPRCAPEPPTQCARVLRSAYNASILTDLPVGIDTTKPWTLRIRFATQSLDAGVTYANLAASPSGQVLGVRAWDGGIESFGHSWPPTLNAIAQDQWHLIEHAINPPAGTVSVRFDERDVLTNKPFPDRNQDKHLGALRIGSDGRSESLPFFGVALDTWISEISMTQP